MSVTFISGIPHYMPNDHSILFAGVTYQKIVQFDEETRI